MGKIIHMPNPDQELECDELDRQGLLLALETVRERVRKLDEKEPEDMHSEAYQMWGEAHEKLEDQVDELLERLDEWEG